MTRNLLALIAGAVIAFSISAIATADPLDGRDILKFRQRPMLATTIPGGPVPPGVQVFRGHNELSTAWGILDTTGAVNVYEGVFMADDFADRLNSPVVHLKWWGSYMNQQTGLSFPVPRFLISFERDVPVGPNNDFSHPGEPLLNQIVSRGPLAPGSGTFTETLAGFSDADGPTFEYNAELHLGKEFPQKPDEIYWLKIVALYDLPPNVPPDLRPRWGWHNRDYTIPNPFASAVPVPGEHVQGFLPAPGGDIPIWHFQDDAVTGQVRVEIDPNMPIMPRVGQREFRPTHYEAPWDGPSLIQQFSKDLAFELYTVPEPSGIMLFALAIAVFALRSRRRCA